MNETHETILFEQHSAFNHILVTENDRGLRALWFGRNGVRQSVIKPGDPGHLESAYTPAMIAGLALAERLEEVLIIGLGGGVIPRFLRACFPQLRMDVVELDPLVVAAAKEFFEYREDPALRTHVADGRAFLEQCDRQYDAILLDVAGPDGPPRALMTCECLRRVRDALGEEGWLIANVWSRQANPHYDSQVTTYRHVFESLHLLDVRGLGNQIFLAGPGRRRLSRKSFSDRVSAFGRLHQLPLDLTAIVRGGFRPGETEGREGKILRDSPVAG